MAGYDDFMGPPEAGGYSTFMGPPEAAAGGGTSPALDKLLGGAGAVAGQAIGQIPKLLYGRKSRAISRKIQHAKEAERARQLAEAMRGSLMQEEDVQRAYERGLPSMTSDIAAKGLADSSVKEQAVEEAGYQQQRHLDAIRRQRANLLHGEQAYRTIGGLQKRAGRLKHQADILGKFLKGGLSAIPL